MKLLGAEIVPVTSGSQSLKDAMNEAMRDWVTNVADTYYLIGTASGPHPFPMMVRDFQSVIGTETRAESLARLGRLPDMLVAAIGGGSNAIGLFHPFLNDEAVKLVGVEAAGRDEGAAHRAQVGARPRRRQWPRQPARPRRPWRSGIRQCRGWWYSRSGLRAGQRREQVS